MGRRHRLSNLTFFALDIPYFAMLLLITLLFVFFLVPATPFGGPFPLRTTNTSTVHFEAGYAPVTSQASDHRSPLYYMLFQHLSGECDGCVRNVRGDNDSISDRNIPL